MGGKQWFGPPSEENDKAKGAFYAFAMDFEKQSKGFNTFVEAAQKKFGSVTSWGTYGLCWGGKVSWFSSSNPAPSTFTFHKSIC
jgi:dienelactone hydrolase